MTDYSLARVPDDLVHCRAFMHSWEPFAPTMYHSTGDHHLFLACTRCGTEKVQGLDAQGVLWHVDYDYSIAYRRFLDKHYLKSRADMRLEVERRQKKRDKRKRG